MWQMQRGCDSPLPECDERAVFYPVLLCADVVWVQDEPEPAARLWLAAVVPLMQQGWHRAAVKLLDRLLAAGCLLRADFTAAAAVQLLSMRPATLEAAMPGDEMIPRLMHACALRALQNFSPPADISLQARHVSSFPPATSSSCSTSICST